MTPLVAVALSVTGWLALAALVAPFVGRRLRRMSTALPTGPRETTTTAGRRLDRDAPLTITDHEGAST